MSVVGEFRIDNGSPCRGELQIDHNVEVVTTMGPKPDPRWSFVDSHGHFHAFDQSNEREPYPTLAAKTRHHGCDVHIAPEMDDDECEGWDETYYVCRICAEEIEPGQIPGPHEHQVEHPVEWQVEIYADRSMPYPGSGDRSVRVTMGDTEYFGIAIVMSANDGSATLVGKGPLGQRKVRTR
jgi:hypothetical protein